MTSLEITAYRLFLFYFFFRYPAEMALETVEWMEDCSWGVMLLLIRLQYRVYKNQEPMSQQTPLTSETREVWMT